MAYIGKVPTAVPLSSADLEDDIITSAKITDGTIALADLSATGTKDSTTFLRGDNTFATAGESNKPIFRVSGGATSVSNNTNTKLSVSSEIFDTDSCFDLGVNNRFTPNKAGKYFINGRIDTSSTSNTDFFVIMFYKNGSSIGGAASINRDYNTAVASQIVEANGSSDYFEVYCQQQSGVTISIALTEFSGFYIGN